MMRVPLAARLAIAAGFLFATFTVVASQVFLRWTGLVRYFEWPYYQFWTYLCSASDACAGLIGYEASGELTQSYLLYSGGAGSAVVAFLVAVHVQSRMRVPTPPMRWGRPAWRSPRATVPGHSDNIGHASWGDIAEAQATIFTGPRPPYGGIVVGEASDPRADPGHFQPHRRSSWGRGGRAPLLIDPCEEGSTHSISVAGSGSYKTVSVVSTLLNWTGSVVVLDPAAELAPMLARDRRRMGHDVYILGTNCGFNVLDCVDITSPMAETNLRAVVEWVCGYTPRRDQSAEFFKNQGKSLVTAVLANMLWDRTLPPHLRTLRSLRSLLAVPEDQLRALLAQIYKNPAAPQLARDLAGPLSKLVAETFGGIYANATGDTEWLSTPAYADLVSGDTFRPSDVTNGRTSVFLPLPLKALDATPAVARCIIGALLNAVYDADGAVNGRVLFMLDEAATLGPMRAITLARDGGRKFGITMHLCFQSVGQIEYLWGQEGWRSWQEAASWISYAAIKDLRTAKDLSAAIGERPVVAVSESYRQNKGSFGARTDRSITYSERPRAHAKVDEIMYDMRSDAQIVFPKIGRPILCHRAIYFRRPEFTARVDSNRFTRWRPSTARGGLRRLLAFARP